MRGYHEMPFGWLIMKLPRSWRVRLTHWRYDKFYDWRK